MIRRPPRSPLFPYTPLSRSAATRDQRAAAHPPPVLDVVAATSTRPPHHTRTGGDRKSTRLNSSHLVISYAVFCLKKKKSTVRSSSLSASHTLPRTDLSC